MSDVTTTVPCDGYNSDPARSIPGGWASLIDIIASTSPKNLGALVPRVGFTGWNAPYPPPACTSWPDVITYAIRPAGFIMLFDVDHGARENRHEKHGRNTIDAAEGELGELPATFKITSRGPRDAGGRYPYRVPSGYRAAESALRKFTDPDVNPDPDVEIVQTGARFTWAPGTVHPKNGKPVVMYDANDNETDWTDVSADDIPLLPEKWLVFLDQANQPRAQHADVDMPEGAPCPKAAAWLEKREAGLAGNTPRGTHANSAVNYLKRMAAEGHYVAEIVEKAKDALTGTSGDDWDAMWETATITREGTTFGDCCTSTDALNAEILARAPLTTPASTAPAGSPESDASTITPEASLNLPEAFWKSSGALTAVRAYAHDYGESADAVLYSILGRIAAYAPLGMTLDTGIKRPVALNLFAALCGYPGDGKSSANRHASYCAWGQETVKADYPFGSGEGIGEVFMGVIERDLGEKNSKGEVKLTKIRCQTTHNAFFYADEGKAMVDLMFSRAGSTLDSTLRSAWFGEMLGQANGRAENSRRVENYALGAVVGFQPGSIAPLIGETELGTAQRFAYAMATDPSIPADYDRKALPPEIAYPRRFLTTEAWVESEDDVPMGTFKDVTLTVTPEVTREYKAYHDGVRKGTVRREPGTEHDLLLKGKLAALLLILEGGGTQVAARQWEAAGMMLDTSHDVRVYMRGLADGIERERRIRAGALAGIEDVSRGANAELFRRASARVTELGNQGLGAREIWQKLSRPQRTAYPSVTAVRQYIEKCTA